MDGREKLVICMVGYTGCGKSYVANKIRRFLTWKGYDSKVFSLSSIRHRHYPDLPSPPLEYYNLDHPKYGAIWRDVMHKSVDELCDFMNKTGQIGILDGSNLSRETRKTVMNLLKEKLGESFPAPLWLEVRTSEKSQERRFMRDKLTSLEYLGVDTDKAYEEFKEKLNIQKQFYEPLEDPEYVYCVLTVNEDNTKHYEINNLQGYLSTTIVSYILNLHPEPRAVFFTRHGESVYNTQDRIGGDSLLTSFGEQYSIKLAEHVLTHSGLDNTRLAVWTSELRRTVQTASHVSCNSRVRWNALNEINAGICEHLTYSEIPQDISRMRKKNKLNYRYPQGESYMDVIERLQPVIFELERTTKPVLIVSHQAVLRCLISYFLDESKETIPYYSVPLHTLIQIVSKDGLYEEARYPILPVQIYPTFPSLMESMQVLVSKKREDDRSDHASEVHKSKAVIVS